MSLKSYWWGLQLCCKPHLNQRFAQKIMGPQSPKLREFQLWEFWDFHLGVPRQNVIWTWASWRGTKYIIRGKAVASPKSGPWWVLWFRVCSWLVLTPKMFKLCTNHLVFGFVQVRVSSWCLSLFLVPSRSSNMPLYPQGATSQGTCPNSLLLCCFQFILTFESIKELGSVSLPFLIG